MSERINSQNDDFDIESYDKMFSNSKVNYDNKADVPDRPPTNRPIGNNGKKKLSLLSKLYRVSVFMFMGALLLFGLISAVDKNKEVSEIEKRTLTEKPKFSFASFFSGDYNVGIENYYSDHFPFRDFFISCNKKISGKFTQFSAGKKDEVVVNVKQNPEDMGGEGVDIFGGKYQDLKENTAEVTPDSEAHMQNNVLVTSNRALGIYYHDDGNINNYTSAINQLAKAVPQGVKVYNLLAPTAMEFYGTEQYRTGVCSQRDSIKSAYDKMDSSVIKIDAYSNLVDHTKEYIYFRTDHHWTARGAYYSYAAFCKASGNKAPQLSSFKVHKFDNFVGSLYGITQASVLKENPDTVECFELSVNAENIIYPSLDMVDSQGIEYDVVADKMDDSITNKYMAFIAGDQPLEKITTSVKNGKKIMVIKDSYGNAVVPFLCNNYEEVYVIDPRKVSGSLPSFIKTHGIQEVLTINASSFVGSTQYLNALKGMLY